MSSAFKSICFIYPDDGQGSKYDRMFPPLGLEIVAAGVKDCVPKRRLIDLRFEKRWAERIPENADLAGFSLLRDMPLERAFSAVRRVRQMRPGIRVVMGGRAAEANDKKLLTAAPEERADMVFWGPDDGRFRAFVESGSVEKIPGAAFLANGEVRRIPLPPYGPIPDKPLPDRSLRTVRYRMIRRDGLDLGVETDAIQSSRGCPFECAFCTFNRDGMGRRVPYSVRSAESVADELEQVEAPFVVFVDDLAFHRPDRMDRLCDVLQERGIRKTYGIETRVNMGMRPQVVEKMARTGFRHVTFGIESMHDHVLEFLNKGLRRRTIEEAFARIRHVPMLFVANFIIGSVGETRAQMLQIPEFARRIGLDVIMVHPLRCRGTEPLTEKVLNTPGYYIDPETRRVCSDAIDRDEIAAIARLIRKAFWTPRQQAKTAWKARRLLDPMRLPSIAWHWATWKMRGEPDPWGTRRREPWYHRRPSAH